MSEGLALRFKKVTMPGSLVSDMTPGLNKNG